MASSSFFKNNGTSSQLQGSASASAAAALASEQAAALSETNSAASAAAALVSKNSAASSAASIAGDAAAAAASATASASSATTASGHATSTAADVVQTGLDSSSASASAAAALLSKNAAASDAAQVATDAAQVAADKVQTAADRVQTGQDVTASAASATSASSSQTASATSAAAALVSQNSAASSATTASGHATSTAADAVQTAADRVQTGLDRTAAASSATSAASAQTGAETALDEFTDLYLGAKNTSGGDPTVDNDGNALQTGALMYDQTNSQIKAYSGSAWLTAAPTSVSFASLTGKPTTVSGFGITDALTSNSSISALNDVDLSTPATNGQALIWDNANSRFIAGDSFSTSEFNTSFAAKSIGDLGDTTFTSLATDEFLKYNGTAWVNAALTSSAAGITLDNFTGDGSTTAFTVTDAPANANSLLVTINGITQRPTTDYTTSGTTLTFTTAPFSGANIASRLVGGSSSGGGAGVNLNSISQSIIPDTDVTYDLGTSSSRFRDLYLSGSTLDLGGSTFSVDDTSGAVAIVPKPTSSTPNPTGVVVTNEGIVKAVTSTGGSVSSSQIQTAASSGTTAPAMTVVANVSDLPSNPTAGTMGYATSNNNLYIYNGSGWYAVAAINQTPTVTGANATYTLSPTGTATVITLSATDPEGFPITWSYSTSGLVSEATVTNVDNVFTITPSTNSAHAGSFDVTFKASDGTNIGTATSTFTLSFLEGDYFWIANSNQTVDMDNTNAVSTVFGSNISLATKGSYAGYGGGKTQNSAAGSSVNALVVDLSNSGGFDASTDLIVFSFYLPSEAGNTIGMGCYDDAAGTSITLATGTAGFGRLDGNLGLFSSWNNNGQWIMAAFGGGNAINSINGTTSSGFRMWPAQTGSTLNTEIGSGLTSGGGYSPPTISQPGMVFWNGGDVGSYTAGYTSRNAMEWYVRSFQVYYDQTTSGRTVEQIVGAHQDTVFT